MLVKWVYFNWKIIFIPLFFFYRGNTLYSLVDVNKYNGKQNKAREGMEQVGDRIKMSVFVYIDRVLLCLFIPG